MKIYVNLASLFDALVKDRYFGQERRLGLTKGSLYSDHPSILKPACPTEKLCRTRQKVYPDSLSTSKQSSIPIAPLVVSVPRFRMIYPSPLRLEKTPPNDLVIRRRTSLDPRSRGKREDQL